MHEPQPWKTIESQVIFRNRWVGVVVDQVALPDGRGYEYTRLEPAGIGVGVIGFNAAGEVLLEREYRHGVGEVVWQIPGGLANGDESLEVAGLRELLEETGYSPALVNGETVRYLGAVWDNPGFGTATSHIFAAWGLEPVHAGQLDETEMVSLHWVSPRWLCDAVRGGEIRDRVVIAAVGYLLLNGWLSAE
jgi:8-oxo-dGTP pyrophosphatase MutT (NUDIX family)